MDIPYPGTYGAQSAVHFGNENSGYSEEEAGFASAGIACNASAEITVLDGWGFTIIGNYFHNSFNAAGFLSENWGEEQYTSLNTLFGSFFPKQNSVTSQEFGAVGNYSYTNYSFFIGINNITCDKNINWEFHFLIGEIFLNLPSINGTISLISQDSANKQQTSNYIWNINSYHSVAPAVNIGVRIGIKVTQHIYAVLDLSAILTIRRAQFDEGNEITNSANQPINPPNLSTWTNVDMLNATIGLEYKL